MVNDLKITLDESEIKIFNNAISKLGKIDQNKVVAKALRAGSKIIIKQGKQNLASRNKVRKGNLKRSFGTKLRTKWKKIYSGFRRPQGASAHLVDRGTKERWTKKGAYRGKVIGSFFWTDAVQLKGKEAVDTLMEKIINEVDKIIK